jgi:hypothetical protein
MRPSFSVPAGYNEPWQASEQGICYPFSVTDYRSDFREPSLSIYSTLRQASAYSLLHSRDTLGNGEVSTQFK